MIKIYCDICKDEVKNHEFSCEMTIQEVITNIETGQKQLKKQLKQICKDCYEKHISKKIKV